MLEDLHAADEPSLVLLRHVAREVAGRAQQQETERASADKNARVPAVNVVWARDSSKFSLVRRDSRKVKDLWVINSLAQPRPTLETYRYAMPGEENISMSEAYVFDVAAGLLAERQIRRQREQAPPRPRHLLLPLP